MSLREVKKEFRSAQKPISETRKTTIGMMGKFMEFPWTQDVIITVGQKKAALLMLLEFYLEVAKKIVNLWLSRVNFSI